MYIYNYSFSVIVVIHSIYIPYHFPQIFSDWYFWFTSGFYPHLLSFRLKQNWVLEAAGSSSSHKVAPPTPSHEPKGCCQRTGIQRLIMIHKYCIFSVNWLDHNPDPGTIRYNANWSLERRECKRPSCPAWFLLTHPFKGTTD